MPKIKITPRRIWFSFVEASIPAQIVVVLLSLCLITVMYVAFVSVIKDGNLYNFVGNSFALLLKPDQKTFASIIGIFYYSTIVFITAVWQAVFIRKILVRPHKYRFSKNMAFYPLNTSYSKYLEQDEYIVFRVMNEGLSDLFDVQICVTFRNYNPKNKTYQHYFCRVPNNRIPVFRRGMPFRIYIHTGEIRINSNPDAGSIDMRFLSPFKTKKPSNDMEIITIDDAVKVIDRDNLDDSAYSFIVYVSGYDVDHSQRKSAAHQYSIKEIERGYFKEIIPRTQDQEDNYNNEKYLFFTKKEIESKFDRIVHPSSLSFVETENS